MTILVTGATGNVGRLVVDELVALGAPVRALTVDPARAALPPSVEVVVGSLARPSSLPLDGVDAVYLAPMRATVTRVCELAREAGIRRLVALSGSSVGDDHEGSSGNEYGAIEEAVKSAGFDWTFLRPGVFMNNTLDWAPMVRAGQVRVAYGGATQTPIHLGDIAAVAAHVLTTEGHIGETYVLSGPEAISQRAQAATIGKVLGREVGFHELTRAEQREQWIGFGIGEDIVDWLLDGFEYSTRHPQIPTGVVEKLLGRAGTTYAEWVASNIDVFR
jgi:uncharacterized protein YbjT (DUF2867 family)